MATWGLFEKRNVETLSRVASARTLDGFKIRARIGLSFPRAMIGPEAEALMMQYARAFATAVERELSGGQLPFEEAELLDVITRRVDALPKGRVRIAGLHVWHKGAVSSRSMPAVQPPGNENPTVPAMKAVRPPEESTANLPAAGKRRTFPHPSKADLSRGRLGSPTGTGYSAVNLRATQLKRTVTSMPAQRASSAPISSTPAASSQPSTVQPTSPSIPTMRAPVSGRRPVLTAPRSSSTSPLSRSALRPSPLISGTQPASEPQIRTASGFTRAITGLTEPPGTALGCALGSAVRDAAAGLLFASLEAVHPTMVDPLKMLDASLDGQVRNRLVSEGCVCISYLIYEALTRTEVPQMKAIEMVQGACTEALGGGAIPVNDMGRYLASTNVRDELVGSLCTILETRETRELVRKVDAILRTLRSEAREFAQGIQVRIADSATANDAVAAEASPKASAS